ncbi:hypothetical protein MJG53_008750 [Ovis ammon polii x Ovis aries]|uniref:Uncharacterized protein n=1 Tax=Ovis ammon polii x Ovis aries TaxID=2918886 RepID=A0ACB9V1E6_9CETA|nr:hypothetical protein MJG53_008750 [Ovis ammon polii x Ovis aries]
MCSVKVHQIRVLETTEGWLMSAEGCGNNTLAVSASFKSQSGPSAQPQLPSLTGRLPVKPSGLHWYRRRGRHGPAPPAASSKPRLCVELAVPSGTRCPYPGPDSAPHPSSSDSVSGRREFRCRGAYNLDEGDTHWKPKYEEDQLCTTLEFARDDAQWRPGRAAISAAFTVALYTTSPPPPDITRRAKPLHRNCGACLSSPVFRDCSLARPTRQAAGENVRNQCSPAGE